MQQKLQDMGGQHCIQSVRETFDGRLRPHKQASTTPMKHLHGQVPAHICRSSLEQQRILIFHFQKNKPQFNVLSLLPSQSGRPT